jgi:cell division transport system permease protein
VTLFVISSFIIFNIIINYTTESLENKIDISVYFFDKATDEQLLIIKNQIAKRDDVADVKYISKVEALEIWNSRQMDERIKNLVTADNNPLPRSLEIKATDPDHLDSIATYLTKDEYKDLIRKVDYQENKDIIQKLKSVIEFSRKLGIALSTVFILISILVILNTIRLTIVTRKDELEIMRLVGANNNFIKIPFFIEAILYGIFGSVLSMIILVIGFNLITPYITHYLGDLSIDFNNFLTSNLIIIILLQLVISISLSVVCSWISIRKYLKI